VNTIKVRIPVVVCSDGFAAADFRSTRERDGNVNMPISAATIWSKDARSFIVVYVEAEIPVPAPFIEEAVALQGEVAAVIGAGK
jgi:hypothetical protein